MADHPQIPRRSEGNLTRKDEAQARRFREESNPQVPADQAPDRSCWSPSTSAANCCRLTQDRTRDQGHGSCLPQPWTRRRHLHRSHLGTGWPVQGWRRSASGEEAREQKAALARGCGGPRETRTSVICEEPLRVTGPKPAGNSREADSRSGHSVWEEHGPPGAPGPP